MIPLHTAHVGLINEDGSTEIVGLFHQDAALMKDLQNSVAYSLRERHDLAVFHSKRLVPKAAPGKQPIKGSFWCQFGQLGILLAAFKGFEEKQQKAAKWLTEQRARAKAWPPAMAASVPIPALPQPRDGRE